MANPTGTRKLLAIVALVPVAVACTTLPERDQDRAIDAPLLDAPALAQLPGEYATSVARGDDEPPVMLEIRETMSDRRDLGYILTQRRSGENERRFLITLEQATLDGNRVDGGFAPLNADGQVRRECAMRFSVRPDGLSGETDPQECSFGEGDQATGLLKEIAFDGRQLVIGDRLVRLADGSPAADDVIQAFYPIRRFSAWAGRREGGAWQQAEAFELHSGASRVEPVDAAGMSLDLIVTLTRYRMGDEAGTDILRLSVSDRETGEVLAQSWADPDAESLGVAGPGVQIGLERIN